MDHNAIASALHLDSIIGGGTVEAQQVFLGTGEELPEPLNSCAAFLLKQPAGTDLRIAATKWYAWYRIEVMAGMTSQSQSNWTQVLLTLADIMLEGGELTVDQQADRAFGKLALRWKDSTRLASDVIEASGRSPFDPVSFWPPLPDPAFVRPVPKYVGD